MLPAGRQAARLALCLSLCLSLSPLVSGGPNDRLEHDIMLGQGELGPSYRLAEAGSPAASCSKEPLDPKCAAAPTDYSQRLSPVDDRLSLRARLMELDTLAGSGVGQLSAGQLAELAPEAEGSTSSLRQVLLLHRHGDRTLITFSDKDPLKDEPFWQLHGLGQLTNRGKARLNLLGQLMRQRYGRFMGHSVNKNQRVSRSSGSLRCIESAQSFLSSFLGLECPVGEQCVDSAALSWDPNNRLARLWQPVNIQSAPAPIDGMLAESAKCQRLNEEYSRLDVSPEARQVMADYSYEAAVLNETLGFDIQHFYMWFWASSMLEVERSYFRDKLRPKLALIYDRLEEAGNKMLDLYQSTLPAKRLRSGLLINDMLQNMKAVRASGVASAAGQAEPASQRARRFQHYSAHDLTLIVMLGILDNSWDQIMLRPEYGSSLTLELHEEYSEWFVRVFYMAEVPAKVRELHLASCERGHPRARCTLERFEELVSPYLVPSWQAWQRECANDLTQLDPYAAGS